jgi:cytochrome c oxidase subunit 2
MKLRYWLIPFFALPLVSVAPHFTLNAAEAAPRRIEVTAKRFSYQPADVTLKAGEPVVLVITSADVPHGLRFEGLKLNAKVAKGKPGELAFTPTKTGDFVGHCSVFCGAGHGSMALTLHVVN